MFRNPNNYYKDHLLHYGLQLYDEYEACIRENNLEDIETVYNRFTCFIDLMEYLDLSKQFSIYLIDNYSNPFLGGYEIEQTTFQDRNNIG